MAEVECDWCGGIGYDPNADPEDEIDCDECDGTGYIEDDDEVERYWDEADPA